jgi:hypothetical protein
MPGASWGQRRGDNSDFLDTHDIAEQGLNVELRQLSRSSQSCETDPEGCNQTQSVLRAASSGKQLKSKSIHILNDF